MTPEEKVDKIIELAKQNGIAIKGYRIATDPYAQTEASITLDHPATGPWGIALMDSYHVWSRREGTELRRGRALNYFSAERAIARIVAGEPRTTEVHNRLMAEVEACALESGLTLDRKSGYGCTNERTRDTLHFLTQGGKKWSITVQVNLEPWTTSIIAHKTGKPPMGDGDVSPAEAVERLLDAAGETVKSDSLTFDEQWKETLAQLRRKGISVSKAGLSESTGTATADLETAKGRWSLMMLAGSKVPFILTMRCDPQGRPVPQEIILDLSCVENIIAAVIRGRTQFKAKSDGLVTATAPGVADKPHSKVSTKAHVASLVDHWTGYEFPQEMGF